MEEREVGPGGYPLYSFQVDLLVHLEDHRLLLVSGASPEELSRRKVLLKSRSLFVPGRTGLGDIATWLYPGSSLVDKERMTIDGETRYRRCRSYASAGY